MMKMVCILCPMGCMLTVEQRGDDVVVTGNECARGAKYGKQELLSPMRVVTTSVWVDGADLPLCPVKTAGEVSKAKIGDVLAQTEAAHIKSPVRIGDVVIHDVAGTGVDVVATANR